MKFNKLVPELAVADIKKSLLFYLKVIGFKIEFQRKKEKFAFLSYQGSQLMLIQDNGDWITAPPVFPRGRGVNFEIETNEIEALIARLQKKKIKLFRELKESSYTVTNNRVEIVSEFLVQDPDGYLLRFQQVVKKKNKK
jgi:catechol 2,3-dioxygenase-like lactoylglutathione lyase family enzyme